jgi:hypothetical protein
MGIENGKTSWPWPWPWLWPPLRSHNRELDYTACHPPCGLGNSAPPDPPNILSTWHPISYYYIIGLGVRHLARQAHLRLLQLTNQGTRVTLFKPWNNGQGEAAATRFCLISVGYRLRLRIVVRSIYLRVIYLSIYLSIYIYIYMCWMLSPWVIYLFTVNHDGKGYLTIH